MKRKIIVLHLLFVFLLLPALVFAQSLDDKLKEIDAYANQAMKDWNQPGMAIAIVKDNKVVFAKGYGVREIGKPEKVDENTLFAIASNSKAFTTAALAILIDEGKIGSWDDKVSKYLPGFQLYDPYVTENLTIRDIVSHRVGLDTFSGDLLWYETTYTNDQILNRVKYLKPVRGFRTGFGYQNLMFIAAGKIVENVSGMKWQDFIRTRILDPLGMTGVKTSVKDYKPGDNVAVPHNESGGKLRALPQGVVDGAAGAVRINASVADLSKWLRLQLNMGEFEGKRIFSERNSWEMWQPAVLLPISQGASRNMPSRHFNAYGLGWNVYDYLGKKIVNHGGGLDGMLSKTVLIPEEKEGFVVLTNGESPVYNIMQQKIIDVLLGAPNRDYNAEALKGDEASKKAAAEEIAKIDATRVPNTKPSLALSGYAGEYVDQLYGNATVTEENGKLVLRFVNSPNFVADLEHWHYDTFQIKWRPSVSYNFPRGFVTFTINQLGKTDQMKINQPNNDFWFYELDFHRSRSR